MFLSAQDTYLPVLAVLGMLCSLEHEVHSICLHVGLMLTRAKAH